jgi:hypothetical protein
VQGAIRALTYVNSDGAAPHLGPLGHGFRLAMFTGLVRDGLATAQPEIGGWFLVLLMFALRLEDVWCPDEGCCRSQSRGLFDHLVGAQQN